MTLSPANRAKCSVSEMMSGLCCLLEAGESGICERPLASLDLCEQYGQFGTVKLPLKRCWVLMRKRFIQGEAKPEPFPVGTVIGGQDPALDDREGDFDLIEATGVDRCRDQNDTRIDLRQPLLRCGSAMRRAVVHDPQQPCTSPIGFLRHHLLDQPAQGLPPRRRCTAAHAIPPAAIPGGPIVPGTTALICVLDRGRSARRGRPGRRATAAGWAAGLLSGAEDGVLRPQGLAWPPARIHGPHRAGRL